MLAARRSWSPSHFVRSMAIIEAIKWFPCVIYYKAIRARAFIWAAAIRSVYGKTLLIFLNLTMCRGCRGRGPLPGELGAAPPKDI